MREVRNKDDHSKVEGEKDGGRRQPAKDRASHVVAQTLRHSTWEAEIE